MTTKTYISPSNIAINIVLNGNNALVHFNSKTIGGSTFVTSSEEVQTAIEKHYNYNRLFFLDRTVVSEDEVEKTKLSDEKTRKEDGEDDSVADIIIARNDNEDGEMNGANIKSNNDVYEETITGETIKVTVSDLVSAREYLNDKFGIEKKTIMSKASILEAAKEHNVEFIGL